MRGLLMVCLLVLGSAQTVFQTSDEPKVFKADDPEQAVQVVLKQLSGGMLTKTSALLARHGDACAVALTKIYGGRDLSKRDINHSLLIIRFSFEAPRIIQVESDRKPRTTLFLLKYLDTFPVDVELKRKIAETRAFVRQATERAAAEKR